MNIDMHIPNHISEIPLGRYQQFVDMQQKSNDEELIAKKMIQIFCGIELKNVVKIKMKDINVLIDHFTKIFDHKPRLKRRFKIKDMEFGFIPNLQNISFGEYVDLENHLQDWNNYHKAMAVMYRPIKEQRGDKYSIVDYEPNEDMQELMKFAPLDVAISASVFFWSLGAELYEHSMNYLQAEMKKMTALTNTRKGPNSQNAGAGIKASINALEAIYPNLMKSPNYHLLNVSPISHSKSKKPKSKNVN